MEYFHQMQLYLDKFLITFNRLKCLLKCYNFKGELLGKVTLDGKLKGCEIHVINKELYFFLDDNKIIIF